MADTIFDEIQEEETPTAKRKQSRKTSKPRTKPKATKAAVTQDKITELIAGIGGITFVVNQYDGQIILDKSEELAKELYNLAQANPTIERALAILLQGSTWGTLLMVASSIIVPIAANHGLLPREAALVFGAEMPPEPEEDDDTETKAQLFNVNWPTTIGDDAPTVPPVDNVTTEPTI